MIFNFYKSITWIFLRWNTKVKNNWTLSDMKLLGQMLEILLSSELLTTKSSVCPLLCVGKLACWTKSKSSNSDINLLASGSFGVSTWKLKSPRKTQLPFEMVSSSGNSSKKRLVVSFLLASSCGRYMTMQCSIRFQGARIAILTLPPHPLLKSIDPRLDSNSESNLCVYLQWGI